MSYIEQYSNQLNKEVSNIPKFVADMIILNAGNIVNEVKRRWILGKSVDGGIIGEYRSEEYRQYKIGINPQAGGFVDLHDTGSLADLLTVKKAGTLFEIYSTDSKFQMIGKKYGFDEFGLSSEEQEQLFSEIYEIAVESIMNNLWR
jgi:hypothetical protein